MDSNVLLHVSVRIYIPMYYAYYFTMLLLHSDLCAARSLRYAQAEDESRCYSAGVT